MAQICNIHAVNFDNFHSRKFHHERPQMQLNLECSV